MLYSQWYLLSLHLITFVHISSFSSLKTFNYYNFILKIILRKTLYANDTIKNYKEIKKVIFNFNNKII